MARRKVCARSLRKKKAPAAAQPKPTDDAVTKLARALVNEFERIELRRWDGWMDQMIQ
jgi:hypothetical protein